MSPVFVPKPVLRILNFGLKFKTDFCSFEIYMKRETEIWCCKNKAVINNLFIRHVTYGPQYRIDTPLF